jgi:hypothetical protein
MKNYKADYYHPVTFKHSEIETKIPEYLVEEISKVLNNLPNSFSSPPMIKPDNLSVEFGIICDENRVSYKISIEALEIPKR